MLTDPPLVLRLELQSVGDAIAGELSAPPASWTVAFTGWLAFAGAIDQATRALLSERGESDRPNVGAGPS